MESLVSYSKKIEQRKGQLYSLQQRYNKALDKKDQLKDELKNIEHAQFVIQTVAQETQENLIYNIENVVTSALEAVLDNPYKFKVIFDIKRNKTECQLLFERDGRLINPLDSSGYGAADLASFALRIAAWSLTYPKKRSVFILDEPFKHLSTELHEKASMLIKELSKKLEIQFIIITHVNQISEHSDKVFRVIKQGPYSNVVEIAYNKSQDI